MDNIGESCSSNIGQHPDILAFNIYLNLLFRKNLVELSLEFFNEMVAKGREPDVVTYTTIADRLCKAKQYSYKSIS